MANFEKRDCENCMHRAPRKREDGVWTAECESWECEFLSRKECIEALSDLEEFRSGRPYRETFIETVLSVAVAFELDELDVAIFLIKRGIKLDDFSYNNDRYNYFKEFFETHGLLKGAENE